MSSRIERAYWKLQSMIGGDAAQRKPIVEELEAVYKKIAESAKDDILAWIPTGCVETETRNVADLQMYEDYEVLQYKKYVVRDNVRDKARELLNEDEAEDVKEEMLLDLVEFMLLDDRLSCHIDRHCDLCVTWDGEDVTDVDVAMFYAVSGWNPEDAEGGKTLVASGTEIGIGCLDRNVFLEIVDAISDFAADENMVTVDEEDDEYELYWNTVWQYNGRVNEELARELGFCIVEFEDGEKFFGLTGCGMDLSPKHTAYQALEYGFIEECFIDKLSPGMMDYTVYVIGRKTFLEVMDRLGLARFIPDKYKEDADGRA